MLGDAMATRTRRRYSPRRSRAERRRQILDAALAIIDREGFGRLTVEGVAREADLAKTVVYDAVGNQAELMQALMDREQKRAIADIASALPAPPFDDPETMLGDGVDKLLNAVLDHPATWRLILLTPEGAPPQLRESVDGHRARLRQILVPIVRWGLKQLRAEDLDPEVSTHALLAAVEQGIRLTLTEPEAFPPERLAGWGRAIVRRVA